MEEGHSFGNLFIAALAAVTGSFEHGVQEGGPGVGRARPALSRQPSATSRLVADMAHPSTREPSVSKARAAFLPGPGVRRVYLEPNDVAAYPEAIRALLAADMIVIGPGSSLPSILPNLLVSEIADAIRASRAFKVLVCNLATQAGETDGYDCAGHLLAIEQHTGAGLLDLILVNGRPIDGLPSGVTALGVPDKGMAIPVAVEDVADPAKPATIFRNIWPRRSCACWRNAPDRLNYPPWKRRGGPTT